MKFQNPTNMIVKIEFCSKSMTVCYSWDPGQVIDVVNLSECGVLALAPQLVKVTEAVTAQTVPAKEKNVKRRK